MSNFHRIAKSSDATAAYLTGWRDGKNRAEGIITKERQRLQENGQDGCVVEALVELERVIAKTYDLQDYARKVPVLSIDKFGWTDESQITISPPLEEE